MPILLKEVIENQRYESADKTVVLRRCTSNANIWKLYENDVMIDYGIYRFDVATDNDCVIMDAP